MERQRKCIISESHCGIHCTSLHVCFTLRLLDVLADRKASSRINGSILVDGVQRRDFRFLSGYVVQVNKV